MSDGTTAIQVSPADVRDILDVVDKVRAIVEQYNAMKDKVNDLSYDNELLRVNNANLGDRLNLCETQLRGEHEQYLLEKEGSDKIAMQLEKVETDLAQARRERDDIGFKHLEVSEELAQANTTLSKFRDLLGVAKDVGVASSPTPAVVEPAAYVEPTPEPKPVTDERAADGPSAQGWEPYKPTEEAKPVPENEWKPLSHF